MKILIIEDDLDNARSVTEVAEDAGFETATVHTGAEGIKVFQYVLYIDAYSGDSIPYHLITREAFRLYLDRLEPDGILALHVSNWHIDLLPICKSFYEEFSLYPYGTISRQNDNLIAGAVWVYFTRDIHRYIKPDNAVVIDWSRIKPFPLPTDERGSLLPLMRLK